MASQASVPHPPVLSCTEITRFLSHLFPYPFPKLRSGLSNVTILNKQYNADIKAMALCVRESQPSTGLIPVKGSSKA